MEVESEDFWMGSGKVPRRTILQRTVPRMDNFPNGYFPKEQFPK